MSAVHALPPGTKVVFRSPSGHMRFGIIVLPVSGKKRKSVLLVDMQVVKQQVGGNAFADAFRVVPLWDSPTSQRPLSLSVKGRLPGPQQHRLHAERFVEVYDANKEYVMYSDK